MSGRLHMKVMPPRPRSWQVIMFTIMCHLLYPIELNILQGRYTEELRKIHGLELEDPRSMPFNVDAAYAAGGGTPHGRYVKVSIVFR
jgi:hypothetical protein